MTSNVTRTGLVNVFGPSGVAYVLTYNVRDRAGNQAIPRTRNVTCIDTTQPVITLLGPSLVSQQGATPWVDPGWYANDTLNGNITAWVVVTGTVSVMRPAGTLFSLNYSVADAAGNQATPRTRYVQIIDTIPPVITLNGAVSVTQEAATPYVDAGATAWDTLA